LSGASFLIFAVGAQKAGWNDVEILWALVASTRILRLRQARPGPKPWAKIAKPTKGAGSGTRPGLEETLCPADCNPVSKRTEGL